MPKDIQPFGAGEGVGFYWIRQNDNSGRCVVLTAIDELGNVDPTGIRSKWDEAAPNREEAVLEHLAGAVSEADAKLERRKAKLPEIPPEPKPKPADPATDRFYSDDGW